MCGRYGRRGDKQRIAEWMQTHNTEVFDKLDETNLAPSFNVAPQSLQLIVRLNGETGERELTIMRWGHEAVSLRLDHLQQREDHWAIVDLLGKGGHIRTVPIPDWVVAELNEWLKAAEIDRGKIFRKVNKWATSGATA